MVYFYIDDKSKIITEKTMVTRGFDLGTRGTYLIVQTAQLNLLSNAYKWRVKKTFILRTKPTNHERRRSECKKLLRCWYYFL